MTYQIMQYMKPMTYDDPIEPEADWNPSPYFYGKEYKTQKGADRAIARIAKMTNTPVENFKAFVNR